jgi:hypothetical protein
VQINLNKPVLSLTTGQVVTLDDAVGTSICAQSGVVWVTEEGNGTDHIVHPGECHIVNRVGRTLVQALQPAWIALQ